MPSWRRVEETVLSWVAEMQQRVIDATGLEDIHISGENSTMTVTLIGMTRAREEAMGMLMAGDGVRGCGDAIQQKAVECMQGILEQRESWGARRARGDHGSEWGNER